MSPSNPAIKRLPDHLQKYVVDQDYDRYSPIDQSVWRFILRQLRDYLKDHAQESYLEGLEKTGISIDKIPSIDEISQKLSAFGWTAVPVSGFIPPAAFMEMQSLGILPIASDIRTISHVMYTPAPDIVHEAAGHAPFLSHPEYADYLREYAEVARHAIISKKDYDQYEAIRQLSDIKEDPTATAEDIAKAEKHLDQVNAEMNFVSEAGWLSRMNWWTAEYGLIGDLENPKIFGAGLLSSVGESKACLQDDVKKIPLSVECIEYSYDITEPQPQLFVAKSFSHLKQVLADLADKMAFRRGGKYGLERAIEAETVNTVQLDSGLEIAGRLVRAEYNDREEPVFIKFEGATQLALARKELHGHGVQRHAHGYSTVLGAVKDLNLDLATAHLKDFEQLGLKPGSKIDWSYASGIQIQGVIKGFVTAAESERVLLITLSDCSVKNKDEVLYQPSWGEFDLALATSVPSVFGGPADRDRYPSLEDDFVSKVIPRKTYNERERQLQNLHQLLQDYRAGTPVEPSELKKAAQKLQSEFPQEWLLRLEFVELVEQGHIDKELATQLKKELHELAKNQPDYKDFVEDGLRLAATP